MKKRVLAILLCMAMYLVPAAALAQDDLVEKDNPQQLRDVVEALVMSGAEIVADGEEDTEQSMEIEEEIQSEESITSSLSDDTVMAPQQETVQQAAPATLGTADAESVNVESDESDRNLDTTFNFDEYDFSDPSSWDEPLEKYPTDEELFGVWDEAQGKYTTEPVLDYDYVSAYGLSLSAVEAAAKAGDYQTAKVELKQYYLDKIANRGFTNTGSNSSYEIMVAQLLLQNFHFNGNSNHSVADIFYIGEEWAPVYVEMKSQITRFQSRGGDGMMPVIICAVNKDDYEAEFYSKENPDAGSNVLGKSPYLEVQIGSTTRRIPVSEDTYTAAGDLRKQNFGSESYLYAREAAIGEEDPVNSDTRRTYLKFDLSSIGATDTITSARLVLWGRWVDKADVPRNDSTYQKRMTALTNYDTGWTENELYFSDTSHTNAMFSYDGEWGTKWVQPNTDRCNPLARFEEELFRFSGWFDKLAYQYQFTKNEVYARAAFMYLHSWITTTYLRYRGCPEVPLPTGNGNAIKLKYGGYSKALDMYSRTSNLTKLIEYFYDSEYMTPELFTTFLKYMYSMGRVFSTYWTTQEKTNNWGAASCSGFTKLIAYYPEFRESEAWSEIMLNRLEEITGNILFDDGACIELAHGYTQYTISTLLSTKDTADSLDVEINYTESIKQKLLTLTRFLMFSTAPGYRDSQEGDSHTFSTSYKSYIKRIADWLGDPQLLWAAYDGKKGEAPDFTSLLYPDSKKVYMRSGWGSDDLYLATSADASQGSHGHWDDNNIIVAAYGNYLLADPLYYMLSGGQDLTCRWLFSSRAHNTMQINDYSQKAAKSVYDPTLPLGGSMGTVEAWETNNSYDFNTMSSENYKNITYRGAPNLLPAKGSEVPPTEPGMDYNRSILFIRDNFWIVSDYMDPVDKTKVNKYTQLWHMDPAANMSIDGQYQLQEGETIGDVNAGEVDSVIENTQFVPGTGNGTIRSNFDNDANILVVPADISSVEPKLLRGLYSYGTGSQQRTPYGLFEKNVQGTTTMDTILFPEKSAQDYSIESTPQQTGQTEGAASAFSAVIKDNSSVSNENYSFDYYLLHEEDQQKAVIVGNSTTDGKLMYYEKDLNTGLPRRVILRGGTYVRDLADGMAAVRSEQTLDEFSVTWENSTLKIDTSKDVTDVLDGVNIYSPVTVKSVLLNGESIPFYYTQSDSYVYFDADNAPQDGKPSTSVGSSGGGGGGGVAGSTSMPHGSTSGGTIASGSKNPGTVNPGTSEQPGGELVGPPTPENIRLKQEIAGHWGETEISALIDDGIVQGSNGTLNLTGNVSRAEFTAMIVRALGIEPVAYEDGFADVLAEDWYADEMQAAVNAGIIQGDDVGLRPEDTVTREEMAKMILAAYQQAGGQLSEGEAILFTDEAQISAWAKDAVDQASKLGLIRGFETGEFRPQENAQREQAMVMIYRLLEGTKQKELQEEEQEQQEQQEQEQKEE